MSNHINHVQSIVATVRDATAKTEGEHIRAKQIHTPSEAERGVKAIKEASNVEASSVSFNDRRTPKPIDKYIVDTTKRTVRNSNA